MHVYQELRERVRAGLEGKAGLVALYTNSGADVIGQGLPAASIQTGPDRVEAFHKGLTGVAPTEKRTVPLIIVLVGEGGTEGLDDLLENIRTEVEAIVIESLAGFAHDVQHTGGDLSEAEAEEGERWFALYALTWDVELVTVVGNPEAVA